MADIPYSDLVAEVHLHCPGAPIPLIMSKLREAAREFCERSTAYRVEIDAITTIPSVADYEVDVPMDTVLVEPIVMWFDGQPLEPASEVLLNQKLGGDWATTRGSPEYVYKASGNTLKLIPVPAKIGALKVTGVIALKPARNSLGLVEWFVEDYYEGIVACANYLMAIMRGTDWYEPNIAAGFYADYQEKADAAKRKANNDNIAKVRTTSYGGY
jgi:hypothetical protein